jgi:hypothetical protein
MVLVSMFIGACVGHYTVVPVNPVVPCGRLILQHGRGGDVLTELRVMDLGVGLSSSAIYAVYIIYQLLNQLVDFGSECVNIQKCYVMYGNPCMCLDRP